MLWKLVGLDPSLRNWGMAIGVYDTESKLLIVEQVSVINPALPKAKQTRQNSLDLESSKQLYEGTLDACKDAHAIFAEVPVGSQTARAMASYGICVGVLGSLRAQGFPLIEVTPSEVKLAGPGKITASKAEMISWAMKSHPEANWPTYVEKGSILVNASKAEHQADATAAIHAGIASNTFKQLLSLTKH